MKKLGRIFQQLAPESARQALPRVKRGKRQGLPDGVKLAEAIKTIQKAV